MQKGERERTAGKLETVNARREEGEREERERVWDAGSASAPGYNGKMEGMGLGRKFANFHDGARIISGWLGGFRPWQMTVVSGYWLPRRPPSHSESGRMSVRALSNAEVETIHQPEVHCDVIIFLTLLRFRWIFYRFIYLRFPAMQCCIS